MRILKIIVAAWAIAFAITMVIFLALLWAGGPSTAERVWTSPYLIGLYVLGLVVAARYLR
jgi:hypothetical protein